MAKESDSRKSGSPSSSNLLNTQRPFEFSQLHTSAVPRPVGLARMFSLLALGTLLSGEKRGEIAVLRATLGPLANNACNANKICGRQYEWGGPGGEFIGEPNLPWGRGCEEPGGAHKVVYETP